MTEGLTSRGGERSSGVGGWTLTAKVTCSLRRLQVDKAGQTLAGDVT